MDSFPTSGRCPPISNTNSVPRLIWATIVGNADLALTSLQEGDDPNVCLSDTLQTPLHLSILHNHPTIFHLLLSSRASITAVDRNYRTPLHYACDAGRDFPAAKKLLELGAPINAHDDTLCTPLHLAIRVPGYYSPELIQHLLEHGADVNHYDNNGRTPLHKVVGDGHCNVAEMLLRRGASVDVTDHEKSTLMHAAVKCYDPMDSLKMLQLLVAWGAGTVVNEADENGSTPLHWAALGESIEVVDLLLECGANINALDRLCRTPLDRAVLDLMGLVDEVPLPDGMKRALEERGGLLGKGVVKPIEQKQSKNEAAVGFSMKGIMLRNKKSDVQIGASRVDSDRGSPGDKSPSRAEGALRNLLPRSKI